MTVLSSYSTMRAAFATTTDRAADGFEEWPSELVLANGFDDGFTGIATPILSFPITVSVDGSANGSEAYDVFLSQRTEVAADQPFAIARATGKSGSWTITMTTAGRLSIGLASVTDPVSVDQLSQILNFCHLYVSRHSDQAIQWVDLRVATLGT